VTTAQEKLVVRVSLGASKAGPAELPVPPVEQRWLWRRIAGAVFTLCAVALLLYGWLNVESPEPPTESGAEMAPVVTTENIEAAASERVLEVVSQDIALQQAEPQTTLSVATESAPTEATQVAEPRLLSHEEGVVASDTPADRLVAETQTETGVPLFSANAGILRLVLLTNETPSAKAHSFADVVDASAVSQLALYSEVQGLKGQTIEHLWYYEGKLMTRIKLPVKLDYWRTYSRKEFDKSQQGEWRVEILDPQQNLLFSHHFHYQ
jgi:hypothetical protein